MQGVLVEPHDVGRELVGDARAGVRRHQHVAARHLDLVLQHQRHRLPLDRAGEIAAMGDDALDPRRLAGFGDHDFVALPDRAGGDGAGKAAEVEIGPVHVLHREAERRALGKRIDDDRLEMLEQASGRNTRPSGPTAW